MKMRRLLTTGGAAFLAAAIVGGFAYATIPGPGNVFSACMLKGIGTIRLIDKSLPDSNLMSRCKPNLEVEVSWNQAGETGPMGPPGVQGPPGAEGEPGSDGVSVTSAPEPPGGNCEHGGAKFTASNGVAYACDGAPGSSLTVEYPFQDGVITVPSGVSFMRTVLCPSGKRAIGGAWEGDAALQLHHFRPIVTPTVPSASGWRFGLTNTSSSPATMWFVQAVCI